MLSAEIVVYADLVVDVAEDEADDGITTAVTIFLGATGCNTLNPRLNSRTYTPHIILVLSTQI